MAQKTRSDLNRLENKANRGSQPELAQQEISNLLALYSAGKFNEALREGQRLSQINSMTPLLHNILGAIHFGLGKLDAAVVSCERALELKPDYAEAHNNLGNVLRDLAQLDGAVDNYQRALELKPDFFEAHNNLGNALRDLGQLDGAVESCERALELKPDYAEAHNNLGNALRDLGQLDGAVESYQRAVELKPNYAKAHNNLGNVLRGLDQLDAAVASNEQTPKLAKKGLNTLQWNISVRQPDLTQQEINDVIALYSAGKLNEALREGQRLSQLNSMTPLLHNTLGAINAGLGKPDAAVASYQRALELNPDYAEVHNNLGDAFRELGQLDAAVASCRQALELNPDYAEAHYNLGNAFRGLGQLDAAVASFERALELRPDYAEAHCNLGDVSGNLGQLDAAVASCERALRFKPDLAEAHKNLGVTFYRLGQLEAAAASCERALKVNPDDAAAWGNLFFSIKTLELSATSKNAWIDSYKRELSKEVLSNVHFSILEYRLNAFTPHMAKDSFNHAIKALPSIIGEEVHNPVSHCQLDEQTSIPKKVIALIHFGRSGTGLLHSLIDSHSEISTLPSIYFSEYFNDTVWKSLISNGWIGLPKRLVEQFSVLFDARSSMPVPSIGEPITNLGKKEGMANVGENRDEALAVDPDIFCTELHRLMAHCPELNKNTFFKLIHVAYEKALNNRSNKHTIFYHIHNPSPYSKLNFLRYNPKARLLMMVREPVQSCESWLKDPFGLNNVESVHNQIITMLFDFDQIAFRTHDTIGVRLEDLKARPKESIASLCDWMGIEESSSLYEMTAQGKKWWGDPTSPDYGNEAMSPFGSSSIKRAIGSIFSEKDQFVLRTLFYPFSVRFGYAEEDSVGFKQDLHSIKPLLNEPFDFEKTLANKSNIDFETFKKSGSYLYLRAGLQDRWEVLNEFHDYPHMLKPLKIKSN